MTLKKKCHHQEKQKLSSKQGCYAMPWGGSEACSHVQRHGGPQRTLHIIVPAFSFSRGFHPYLAVLWMPVMVQRKLIHTASPKSILWGQKLFFSSWSSSHFRQKRSFCSKGKHQGGQSPPSNFPYVHVSYNKKEQSKEVLKCPQRAGGW